MVTEMLVLVVGAENIPVLEIVPAVEDQVTAVLLVPVTYAVNCCEPADVTVALLGDTLTVTPAA